LSQAVLPIEERSWYTSTRRFPAELVGWTIPPRRRAPRGLSAPGFTDLQISKKDLVVRYIGKDATVFREFNMPVDLMQDI
jgi:hypothetical protein